MTGAFPMCQPGRSIWGRHLAMALIRNPELEAFSYAVRAAEARVLQAGVRPNTELQVELDEYDRDGAGLNSAETAVVLAQAFELGGKRKWRRLVAEAEGELAGTTRPSG